MSIEVGHCERVISEGKPDVFYGELAVEGLQSDFYIVPVPDKRTERSPDMALKIRGRNGQWVHFGNVWLKDFRNGAGQFMSIQIDGYNLPAPVNVAAFPDDEQPKDTPKGRPSQYTIRWGRPRGGRGAPPMDQGAAAAPLNDEIPY
jgi:uncharacterized protein (DUF736 family)